MKSGKLKRDLAVVQLCETHSTSLAFKGHLTLLKRHFAMHLNTGTFFQ